jgi:hypothetical protein
MTPDEEAKDRAEWAEAGDEICDVGVNPYLGDDPTELLPEAGMLPVAEGPIPDGEVPGQLTMEEVARAQRVEATRLEGLGPGSTLSEGLLWKGYRGVSSAPPGEAIGPGANPED